MDWVGWSRPATRTSLPKRSAMLLPPGIFRNPAAPQSLRPISVSRERWPAIPNWSKSFCARAPDRKGFHALHSPPSTRFCAWRGGVGGWGVVQHSPEQRFQPIDPPPPTPQSELRSSRPRRFRLRRGFGGHVAGGGEKRYPSSLVRVSWKLL